VRDAAIGQGATDAWPAGPRGWAGQPRPSGERESGRLGKEKGSGLQLGRKPELGTIQVIKPFLNFYLEFKFLATLKICTRRFRRNFDMGIFPKIFWAFLGFLEMKMNGM
jgi:hypothetical protein